MRMCYFAQAPERRDGHDVLADIFRPPHNVKYGASGFEVETNRPRCNTLRHRFLWVSESVHTLDSIDAFGCEPSEAVNLQLGGPKQAVCVSAS